MSAGVDKFGQEFLQEQVLMVKIACGGAWDRDRVSAGAGRIGQECLREQKKLVKSAYGTGYDWSRV